MKQIFPTFAYAFLLLLLLLLFLLVLLIDLFTYLFIYLFIYLLIWFICLIYLSIYLATKQIISNIFLKGLGQNKPRVEESRLFRKCVGAEPRERRENKINTFAQGGVNVRKNSPVTLWILWTSRGEWRAKDIAGVKGVAYS